jgi:hypothetical protein
MHSLEKTPENISMKNLVAHRMLPSSKNDQTNAFSNRCNLSATALNRLGPHESRGRRINKMNTEVPIANAAHNRIAKPATSRNAIDHFLACLRCLSRSSIRFFLASSCCSNKI